MSYSSTVLSDSPLYYWRLNDASGATTAADSGSAGSALTKNGGTFQAGALIAGDATASSWQGDGSSAYLVNATPASWPGTTKTGTVECWVKLSSADVAASYDAPRFIDNNNPTTTGSGSGAFGLGAAGDGNSGVTGTAIGTSGDGNGFPYGYLDEEGIVCAGAGASFVPGNVYHLVATYDGTNGLLLYVNGVQVGSSATTYSNFWFSTANAIFVGCLGSGTTNGSPGGLYSASQIAEVALYTTALSATRILAHYNAGLGSTPIVPVALLDVPKTTVRSSALVASLVFAASPHLSSYPAGVPGVSGFQNQAPLPIVRKISPAAIPLTFSAPYLGQSPPSAVPPDAGRFVDAAPIAPPSRTQVASVPVASYYPHQTIATIPPFSGFSSNAPVSYPTTARAALDTEFAPPSTVNFTTSSSIATIWLWFPQPLSTNAALTGWSATTAEGSLTEGVSVPLTGQSVTTAQGTITSVQGNVDALTGVSATTAQGSIAAVQIAVAPTGFQATTAQGSVSEGVTVGLTGYGLSTAQGTVSSSQGESDALTGYSLTTAEGSIAAVNVTVPLTGQALTTAEGGLTSSGGGSVNLTGYGATSAQGAMTPSSAVSPAGQQANTLPGNIAANVTVGLTGYLAISGAGSVSASQNSGTTLGGYTLTSAQGSFGSGNAVALTGNGATIGQGAPSENVTVGLTGVAMSTAPGAIVSGLQLPSYQLATAQGAMTEAMTIALTGAAAIVVQGSLNSVLPSGVMLIFEGPA